jgi:branched-chain amino acid transport system ATP-binding protein
MTTSVLDVTDLHVAYGPYGALFGVDFTVESGGVLAILGANGAGKSTVARAVSGLVQPTSGGVVVDGLSVVGKHPAHIVRCGLVHLNEGRAIFAGLTVEENLRLVGRLHGRSQVRAILADAFDAFPALGAARHRVAGSLSGGEQRQLSLMKALALRPKVLVADELSLGLSPSATAHIYERLHHVNADGVAMVIIESQLEHVRHLAHAAIVLEHGRQRFAGSFDDAVADITASVRDLGD